MKKENKHLKCIFKLKKLKILYNMHKYLYMHMQNKKKGTKVSVLV